MNNVGFIKWNILSVAVTTFPKPYDNKPKVTATTTTAIGIIKRG